MLKTLVAPGHNTGETALHLASSYDTAMALLEAKACPDITDDLGAKAFFRAGENGREDVAKAFLDAGVLASLGRKQTPIVKIRKKHESYVGFVRDVLFNCLGKLSFLACFQAFIFKGKF